MRSCLRLDFKSCSPDPATNSEIKNHNFHDFFDQLEEDLQV